MGENQQAGNQTANTPHLSETELRGTHVGELRERARREGVAGASEMRQEELVRAISALHRGEGGGARAGSARASAGGNETPATPDVSETEMRAMHIDELRERARQEGVAAAGELRKEELVDAISALHRRG